MTRMSARLKDTTARGSYPALRTSVRMRSLSKEAGRLPAIRTAFPVPAGRERAAKQKGRCHNDNALQATMWLACLTAMPPREVSAHIHGVDRAKLTHWLSQKTRRT